MIATDVYTCSPMLNKVIRPNIFSRWEDNIKIDLKLGLDWIQQAQNRVQWLVLVNTVVSFWVSQKAGNSLTIWATVNVSRTLLH